MKTALSVGYFVASLALLMFTFRIDYYLQNSTLSKTSTVASYVILALLLTFVASFLAPKIMRLLFPRLSEKGNIIAAIAIAGIIFILLCAISVLFGPFGLDVPVTRIRGIFFSEWNFIRFILYDAIFLAFLGGLLTSLAKT